MAQPRLTVCSGSPFEMGLAQGAALRDSIRAMPEELRNLEAFRLQQPWWLPYAAYVRLAERKAKSFLTKSLVDSHPAAWQRLDGIAQGAGVSVSGLLLINAMEAVLSDLGDCTTAIGGCSAIAVSGSRSSTGSALIAKNFDYLPLVQPYYIVRESRPNTGYASLDFSVAPFAGAIDGVNERGLCITYNYAFTTDKSPVPAVPISILIGEALQNCDSVDGAAEWIASRSRHGGGILMLADETGDVASLELSSTRSCLRRPSDGQDAIFHTNSFLTEPMREVQLPQNAEYSRHAPTPLRGRRVHHSSETRDARMTELIGRTATFGPDQLAAIMSDHGPDDAAGDFTLCVHGSYWFTTASLQLHPAERTLRVSYSTTCEAEYRDFELGAGTAS